MKKRSPSPSPLSNNPRQRARSNTDRFSDNQLVSNLKGKALALAQPALDPSEALKINGISPHKAKMEAYNPAVRGRAANLARIRSLSKDNNPIVPKDFSAPSLKLDYGSTAGKPKGNDRKSLKENKAVSKTTKNLEETANEEEKNEQFETGEENQSIDGISWELKLKTSEKQQGITRFQNNLTDMKKKYEMKMSKIKERAENKTKELNASKAIDVNDLELSKLEVFFRFRLFSIFRIIDDKVKSTMMWASTKAKKKPLGPSFGNNNSKESDTSYERLKDDIWKQLKRIASTKSKYKYRDILNFEKKVQQVLKDLFGKIPPPPKCDMDLELDDVKAPKSPEQSKPRSHDTTVKEYLKTFIIIGGYPDLAEALEKRGWTEVEDSSSTKFHLKWSSKKSDSGYDQLEPYQWVNHFEKNTTFTTKAGLSRNIRNLIWYGTGYDDDVDKLYPLCYDINDIGEFEDFIEQYKFGQAICVLRAKYSAEKTGTSDEINLITAKICAAVDIIQKRMKPVEEIIKDTFKNDSPWITSEEYELLTGSEFATFSKSERFKPLITKYSTLFNAKFDDTQTQLDTKIIELGEDHLKKIEQYLPQINFNQGKNAWIVKPAGLSRGRGIACHNNLADIIDHIRIKDVEWVVQKYMENPLIILNKKFDIRQWVLVTDWNPLTVWFYDECYVRFTANDYNPEDFSNKFSHLTNNSIAKHAENFETSEIEGNMWSCGNLAEYLKKTTGKDQFEAIQKRMKEITIKSLQSVNEMVNSRKNSFELFGYDFMIDDTLRPWLIEINCSPTMEYSTSVTTRLVKMVMEDVAKVIVDYGMARKNDRKNINTGLFKCICYGKPLI